MKMHRGKHIVVGLVVALLLTGCAKDGGPDDPSGPASQGGEPSPTLTSSKPGVPKSADERNEEVRQEGEAAKFQDAIQALSSIFLINASKASGPSDSTRDFSDEVVPGFDYVPSWTWEGLDSWDSMVDRSLSVRITDYQDATEAGAPPDTPNSVYRTFVLTLEAKTSGQAARQEKFFTTVVLNVELAMGPEGHWLIKNIMELR